jgi:adenosine/AMP kinase
MDTVLLKMISEQVTVRDDEGQKMTLRVWRQRTSDGRNCIGVVYGATVMQFNTNDYEKHAKELLNLLQKICDDKCELPE